MISTHIGNCIKVSLILFSIPKTFFNSLTNKNDLFVGAQEEVVTSYSLDFDLQGLDGDYISVKDKVSGQVLKSIISDGKYSFSDPVQVGDAFKLVLTKQPEQLDQTCTIENGKGVMSTFRYNNKQIVVTCHTPVNHVVIIGIDGMGGAYLREEESSILNVRTPNVPYLDGLRSESAYTFLAQDAVPSSSSTNWCSMLGGNPPDVHGVLSNSWERGDSVIPPTLFSVARDNYPTSQIGLLYDWNGLGRLIEDNVADVKMSPGDADETANAAMQYIIDNRPLLTFVHLDLCDYAGHGYGWGSEEYVSSLETADTMIGNIINTLKDEGMWSNTALIISSDHGGEGSSHGDDTYLERSIPFIVKAPQSTGKKIKREVRIWDVAATAAAFLGLEHPSFWVSSPVYEAIPYSAEWESMATAKVYYKVLDQFELIYDTSGTNMRNDLSIMRPLVPSGYSCLGDVAFPGLDTGSQTCELDKSTCSCMNDNIDYRGSIATTTSGKNCQKWSEQTPHLHTRTPERYPNAGLGDHNYCRNPDGEDGAWCYTTDENSRWELCEIPSCPMTKATTITVYNNHSSVVHPKGYELIWTSSGTTDDKPMSLWNPIPPTGGFTCPGQVTNTSPDEPPATNEVACISETYLNGNDVSNSIYIWNDSGSGADMDGSIWKCEGDKSVGDKILDPSLFVSRRDSSDPGNNDCRVLKAWKFIACKDDQTFRFKNKESRDCVWVGDNVSKRCKKRWNNKRVYEYCPQTCEKC